VIVAVKGVDEGFEENLERLLEQDYPGYGILFSVASESDPAYPLLADLSAHAAPLKARNPGLRAVKMVIAGHASGRGEKVNNLLAALRQVPPATEVLVFADADARPRTDWLRSLIAPLADPKVTVSTGIRWYLPGRSAASRLRAAWDTSIATMLGEHRRNFAWGGSMAVRRADFERLRVAERYWTASVSDDYGLTRAVRDAGGWIRFEPRCLVASADEIEFGDFLRWSNRQIIITRVYAPHYWHWGLASYMLFCSTCLLGLGAAIPTQPLSDRLLVLAMLAAIFMLGIGKARLRTRVAATIFPEEAKLLGKRGSSYWRWWPLVPWWMLLNFVTAGLTNRIEWRGVKYQLRSASEVRVLSREE
jgi:cellulose synthase/poly-beta-1,6-N-acetylglucosamine synthase-like glycosyltransferase